MAMDRDELNKRRRDRELARKKRQQTQRRLYIRLAIAALVLIACGVGIFRLTQSAGIAPPVEEVLSTTVVETEATEAPTEEPTEGRAVWEQAPVTINLVAGGDLNVTDKVVWSGQLSGEYNYTKTFMDVAPILSEADLAVLNFEGNVCGMPFGSATMSAPVEMIQALKAAGVDLLQMANSCSIRNGLIGLTTSLNNIRSAGIEPLGAFSSSAEFQKSKGYTIVTVSDIKIAFVAFTKGVGSLGMPAGSEDCVNLLYEDYSTDYKKVDTERIDRVLRNVAEEQPDLTIAMVHWGSEYNDEISASQDKIRKQLQAGGVDIILGTHPHLVQRVDYDSINKTLVAWSLGDFFGDAVMAGTNYSVILDMEVTRDNATGEVFLSNWEYIPIFTLKPEQSVIGGHRVVRIREAMERYEAEFVGRITEDTYGDMQYALKRIEERVNPKKDEQKQE